MITYSAVAEPDILALGRAGLSRAEIVASLGITLAEAAEREAADPAFAAAMALADEAARAWWAGLQREAMGAGARWGQGAWRDAVRWRFGLDGVAETPEAVEAPAPGPPEVIVDLPDNGTRREFDADGRLLNGTPAHEKTLALRNADYLIRRSTRDLATATKALEAAHARKAKIAAMEISAFDPDGDDPDGDDDGEDDENGDDFG